MRQVFLTSLFFLSVQFFALGQQDSLHIVGSVQGDLKGFDKIYVYGQEVPSDSARIENGHFTFSIPFKAGMAPFFMTQYSLMVRQMYEPFPAVIDSPGTLYLDSVDITEELNRGRWRGMASAEIYQAFDDRLRDSLQAAYQRSEAQFAQSGDSTHLQAWEASMNEIYRRALGELVDQHADSYAAVFALNLYGRNFFKPVELRQLFDRLDEQHKETPIGRSLMQFVAGAGISQVGMEVPDFTLAQEDGDEIAFSSLRGKYVLIDFWASWCVPCIEAFPHLKSIYAKYKDKNFEIYGISIDKNRESWLQAMEKLQLPWLLTLDTADVSKSIFGIRSIPTTILVGPDGTILHREIGFNPNVHGKIVKELRAAFEQQ